MFHSSVNTCSSEIKVAASSDISNKRRVPSLSSARGADANVLRSVIILEMTASAIKKGRLLIGNTTLSELRT
jgi:hypothetical protein